MVCGWPATRRRIYNRGSRTGDLDDRSAPGQQAPNGALTSRVTSKASHIRNVIRKASRVQYHYALAENVFVASAPKYDEVYSSDLH
jgi:hypothetical protein